MDRDLHREDSLALVKDLYAKGRVNRRDFLSLCAILGASAAGASLGGRKALAADEITISNFGGDAIKAYTDAWTAPFTADTGVNVAIDGAGPLPGNIKKMVDEKNVIWDVSDGDAFYGLQLGPDYLEPIDYSVVDPAGFFDWNKYPLSAGNYVYSYVLAYDKTKLPEAPTSWADLFDLKKFPGKRTLWKWFMGMPEIFMLAAGKAPEDVYPIDMKLVVEMVKSLGDNLVLWDSGASSQQLFLDGEVVMGNIWNTRCSVLERDTEGRVTWTWNQQIVSPGAWCIPKGGKKLDIAQKFIASTQDPKRQITLLDALGNGPANPAALPLLTEEQKRINPTSHLDVGVIRNEQWYAENYDNELNTWLDAIAG
ncbi:extracellular solute-binding protein [Zavarzinia compransoris]|uniref:extracellular solute-binding protein n=1 Tax=Zavarzinia marina TaxID=2911065 RepID=UPI001F22C8CF|nr:extracellular solute-binding protein [Zavarzinia marina]MCF4166309.1 extracellular solute-binding protein [Zavarzinia marina]